MHRLVKWTKCVYNFDAQFRLGLKHLEFGQESGIPLNPRDNEQEQWERTETQRSSRRSRYLKDDHGAGTTLLFACPQTWRQKCFQERLFPTLAICWELADSWWLSKTWGCVRHEMTGEDQPQKTLSSFRMDRTTGTGRRGLHYFGPSH